MNKVLIIKTMGEASMLVPQAKRKTKFGKFEKRHMSHKLPAIVSHISPNILPKTFGL